MTRYRSCCYTLNNYTDDDVTRLQNYAGVKYHVFGKEVGESGTPHLQGYIVFSKQLTFNQVRNIVGNRAHVERTKGTPQEASNYCKKDGSFFEKGELPQPGTRNDLQLAVSLLRESGSLRRVATELPATFIRYHRGLSALIDTAGYAPERNFKTITTVFVGRPGIGKSMRARSEALMFGDIYYKPHGDWWDGYEGQTTVILDDFYGSIRWHDLLNLLDRYPLRVPIKGGFRQFTSKYIYITSNTYVSKWYSSEKFPDQSALFRRLDNYIELLESGYNEPWFDGYDRTASGYNTDIGY